MLILLTPSKTMDTSSLMPFRVEDTKPLFTRQSMQVYAAISALHPDELIQIMKMSRPLAEKTWQQYHAEHAPKKPALWTYVGDVYRGIQAATMTRRDAEWAQEHLLIASALFGLVRPFDGIFAYRLEMQAKLKVGGHSDLYDFWSKTLTDYIRTREKDMLIVLSSEEYAKAVTRHIDATLRIITPRFLDTKPSGKIGQVPIYNKQMRGVMARWMIDNRVEDAGMLHEFSEHGYIYDPEKSTPESPAFTRKIMKPLDLPSKANLQDIR